MSRPALRPQPAAVFSALAPLTLVGAVVALGAGASPSLQGTLTLCLCNLIIVCGLQVFIGNSGVYSFGQLGFAMAGAYLAALVTVPQSTSAFQTPGLPAFLTEAQFGPLGATLLAAAGAAGLALLVGLPLMRTSTLAIPISTFAFLIVIYNVLANWDAVTGGSGGLVNIPKSTGLTSAGIWAALAILIALAFKRSASGHRLLASREDEAAARSLGVGVVRERMIGFVLSAALCGAGGALAAQRSGVITPETFYFSATVTTLTMLVLGGAGSVLGATLGTLAMTALNEVLRGFEEGQSILGLPGIGERPGLAAIGVGLTLLVVVIARPAGLTGGREAGKLLGLGREREAEGSGVASPAKRRVAGDVSDRALRGELVVEGVSVAFGGLQVLRDVGLQIRQGETLGLIGPNGAGKTTLVNVISGFQAPDSGTISVEGRETTGWSPQRLARGGLVRSFQAARPFADLSCLENVAIGAMGVGADRRGAMARGQQILRSLGLGMHAERSAGSLPAGSQRLVGIARALATRPRILMLDEPAAGLSEEEGAELVDGLRAVVEDLGCGLVLIEHDMSIVMNACARVQVLDEGQTVAIGAPAEIQSDPAVLESYLGSDWVVAVGA